MRYLAADEPFFREWKREQTTGQASRSVARASALKDWCGLPDDLGVPTLIVVGSKGKGTVVAAASAQLAGAGHKVGSISSPPLRSNLERIRVNGRQISEPTYAHLAAQLAEGLAQLGPAAAGEYLSPAGAFLVAGVNYLREVGCTAIVLEEGMGGKSDEISLFAPTVVAVTEVFLEHQAVLGDTVAEIAADLVGVTRPGLTRAVVTFVGQVDLVKQAGGGGAGTLVGVPRRGSTLLQTNRELGIHAAHELVGTGVQPRFGDLNLPGRLSRHGEGPEVLVDSAINPAGVENALRVARELFGEFDVIASFPDDKPVEECVDLVCRAPGVRKIFWARPATPHLRYHRLKEAIPTEQALKAAGRLGASVEESVAGIAAETSAEMSAETSGKTRRPLLAVGTISFISEILDWLAADASYWWKN